MRPTLEEIVAAKPYRDYADWWPMGEHFLGFMADAIHANWEMLQDDASEVARYAEQYIRVVYGREARPTLVGDFVEHRAAVESGEFDALSYAFYRSAYEELARRISDPETLIAERRQFTRRVGKRFFSSMVAYLKLDLPTKLESEEDHRRLTRAIEEVGAFLHREGYLRTHFAFRLDVDITHRGHRIRQRAQDFPTTLDRGASAYALYEMGYPAIMPSAVYLYQTIGEAQHHSSRTIEELFDRVGCTASETRDFDPTGYPADLVVELWEIRKRA
jgi:hypothetical protein